MCFILKGGESKDEILEKTIRGKVWGILSGTKKIDGVGKGVTTGAEVSYEGGG